ncbi:MAG: methionyl-tRNA formyltransferase [Chloroflexota bacterium]|nr:methionyl-tRNA formyltransferase [Chloroflexota bacterium]MQG38148.1 methionyl-tRNA formyltransferase [SAR202 cluster bacterium]|tara:strand:- start:2221 stop:3153 length:933 start_codon:yes stop_codon:yes gene_type:complete
MKIIFFGSPNDAVQLLDSLITAGHEIAAVYTQPDRQVGRGLTKQATAVKIFSEQCGLETFTPVSLRDDEEEFARISNIGADAFVVVAYGRILPPQILDIPPLGVINVHPSLLPLYRGPSPVSTAILDGQSYTGVSLMLLDAGMDTGPVLAQSLPINLSGRERRGELQTRLFKESKSLLLDVLTQLDLGTITPVIQDNAAASMTQLLRRSDGEIDWTTSAVYIERMVRAYDIWPGTFTTWNGKNVKILESQLIDGPTTNPGEVVLNSGHLNVSTGDGLLEIIQLQLEGRQAAMAPDFVRGYPQINGVILGN